MPRFRRASLGVALLAAALTLSACGSVGGNPSSASASPTDADVLRVKLTDMMTFEPSSFTVKVGERVTLQLQNVGTLKHNFTLDDGSDPSVSQDVAPGGTANVSFTAPSKPGQVTFYCDEPGHREAGMVGVLVVER